MRKIYIPFLCCTAVLLGACSDEETFHPDYQLTIEADTTMAVTVSDATPHQTIDGFGSSDAWDMEYVGRYWSDQQKSAIAKMLFRRRLITDSLKVSACLSGVSTLEAVRQSKAVIVVLLMIAKSVVWNAISRLTAHITGANVPVSVISWNRPKIWCTGFRVLFQYTTCILHEEWKRLFQ